MGTVVLPGGQPPLLCKETLDTSPLPPIKRQRKNVPAPTPRKIGGITVVDSAWFGNFDNPHMEGKSCITINEREFDVIGSGSYGRVILAKVIKTNQLVAIKVLKAGTKLDDTYREATLTRDAGYLGVLAPVRVQLDPTDVIMGYRTGLSIDCIPIEYCDGHSLQTLFHLTTTNSKRDMFYEVTTGFTGILRQLKECGIVHGDLTSTNLMVGNDGAFIPIDFGLAGYMDRSKLHNIVRSMKGINVASYSAHSVLLSVMIDPRYPSLTRWSAHKIAAAHHRLDWWSIGALLIVLFWNEEYGVRETEIESGYITCLGTMDKVLTAAMAILRMKIASGIEVADLPNIFTYLPETTLPTPMQAVISYFLDAGMCKLDPFSPAQIACLSTLLDKCK